MIRTSSATHSARKRSDAIRGSSPTRSTSVRAPRTTPGRRRAARCTASAASRSLMDLSRFGAAPPWSLGVEEELMLVEAGTLEPARDGFSRVFGEAIGRIKPELFESFVEITTGIVGTPEEAEAELRDLRQEVGDRAAEHGLAVLATGSHPTARGRVPLVPVERYLRLKSQLGPQLYRQHVCGLHVHV